MKITQTIWDSAELIGEWDNEGLRWKLFRVPRQAIDPGVDDEPDAHLVVGIDAGGVRRHETLHDSAFGRRCELLPKEAIQLIDAA
jgi:hypothetical protein